VGMQRLTSWRFIEIVMTLALILGLGLLNLSGVRSAADWPAFSPAAVEKIPADLAGPNWWKQPIEEKIQMEIDMPWGVGGTRG